MKKETMNEFLRNQKIKNGNSTIWIRMISVVLSIAIVAVGCLGIAFFTANDKIAGLQTELNGAKETLEALHAENQSAASEIAALQSGQALSDEELETLTAELAALQAALTQSKETQEALKNSLNAMKTTYQSAQNEIDQLKTDIENANEEITTLKEQIQKSEGKIRIYIDQGHNPTEYHNSGAVGNGLYEENLTFLIGCLLAELLEEDGRFEVQLSRPNENVVLGTDTKSSLMARVNGAADFQADYLISLHVNSFEQNTVSGLEVHVAESGSESYAFGESLLQGLVETTDLRNRGMWLTPELDILEFSAMPAVLVEMGFISNSTDAALLSEHPERFAQGIYNGILDHLGLLPSTLAEA